MNQKHVRKPLVAVRVRTIYLIVLLSLSTGQGQPLANESMVEQLVDGQGRVLFHSSEPDSARRCLAHEMSVPVQGVHISGSGVHISGSVGGMVLGDVVYTNENGSMSTAVPALTPFEVLSRTGILGAALQGDVVILVADDFAGGRFEVPLAAFTSSNDDSARDLLRSAVDAGEFSHGALVMHHLNTLIDALEGFSLVEPEMSIPDWGRENLVFWQQEATGFHLIVAGVDLSSGPKQAIDSAKVASLIAESKDSLIDGLTEHDINVTGVVLNMSWVLLPCPTVEDFLGSAPPADLVEYVESLPDYQGLGFEAITNLIAWAPGDHELSRMLDAMQNEDTELFGRIAFVAASGNFALTFQMLPAAWPKVVGAGVTHTHLPTDALYSNKADVVVVGDWISLVERGPHYSATQAALKYAGTSFASPLTAMYVALDIGASDKSVGGAPKPCGVPGPDNSPEPLLLRDASGTPYPAPEDTPVADAFDRCEQQQRP